MKKQTSVLFAAAMGLVIFAGAAQAQGNGSIVIHRGATAETVRFDHGNGVTVERGQPATKRVAPVRKAAHAPGHASIRRVAAGETLWIVDAKTDRLFACELRNTTQVDGRKIRCRSGRLR